MVITKEYQVNICQLCNNKATLVDKISDADKQLKLYEQPLLSTDSPSAFKQACESSINMFTPFLCENCFSITQKYIGTLAEFIKKHPLDEFDSTKKKHLVPVSLEQQLYISKFLIYYLWLADKVLKVIKLRSYKTIAQNNILDVHKPIPIEFNLIVANFIKKKGFNGIKCNVFQRAKKISGINFYSVFMIPWCFEIKVDKQNPPMPHQMKIDMEQHQQSLLFNRYETLEIEQFMNDA